jgi:hypothetical protein
MVYWLPPNGQLQELLGCTLALRAEVMAFAAPNSAAAVNLERCNLEALGVSAAMAHASPDTHTHVTLYWRGSSSPRCRTSHLLGQHCSDR